MKGETLVLAISALFLDTYYTHHFLFKYTSSTSILVNNPVVRHVEKFYKILKLGLHLLGICLETTVVEYYWLMN